MAKPLDGKTAIVTGSSRGIGKAIALQLAADGASVVVCARTEQPTEDLPGSIGETAEAVRAGGGKALALKVDVTVDSDLEALVEKTLAAYGRITCRIGSASRRTLTRPPRCLHSKVRKRSCRRSSPICPP